ncbi:MAG TPA: hypothetical protein DDX47_01635 [Candidatus Jacksonbacteria bacterium]|nr:MAG: hypothetical protein A2240_01345 [Candidatus Jacksonbacteria bacterium RIFOXYA2_FULL_43_12]HBH46049.1 hypothetical protein [Candidatus Jacksonbacteria bacterium]
MDKKQQIVKKYKGKLLGVEASGKGKDYFVEDFLDEKQLLNFLVNLYDHETEFTKLGFKFLEEYYSIDYIVGLLKREEPDFPYGDPYAPKDYLYMKAKYAIDE